MLARRSGFGARVRFLWRAGGDCGITLSRKTESIDLSRVDLSRVDLPRIDLSRIDLSLMEGRSRSS